LNVAWIPVAHKPLVLWERLKTDTRVVFRIMYADCTAIILGIAQMLLKLITI